MIRLHSGLLLSLVLVFSSQIGAEELVRASADRMQSRIDALGTFGTNPEGGVSRVAFSDADLAGRAWLAKVC